MILVLVGATVLYCAVAFLFFTLSMMELCETGTGTLAGFAAVTATALFWPVTVVVVLIAARTGKGSGDPAALSD